MQLLLLCWGWEGSWSLRRHVHARACMLGASVAAATVHRPAHMFCLPAPPACLPACLQGIKLRGDINVAIVGDPACAKSQMLK